MSEGLGAWEDRPQRILDVDLTRAAVGAREVFVWTRIDGTASIVELATLCGMSPAETVQILHKLLGANLISMEAVSGARHLVRNGPPPAEQQDLGGQKVVAAPQRPAPRPAEPAPRADWAPSIQS